MPRCASALELPDYAALLLLSVVAQISKSSLSLRAAVSPSRPLPEEWVIICPRGGQIRPVWASCEHEQHFPCTESFGSTWLLQDSKCHSGANKKKERVNCELLILMTCTDRAAVFVRGILVR